MNPGNWLCATVSFLTIAQRCQVWARSAVLIVPRSCGPKSVGRGDLPSRQAGGSQGGPQAVDLGGSGLDQGRPQAADVAALQPQASVHQDAALGSKDPGVDRQK